MTECTTKEMPSVISSSATVTLFTVTDKAAIFPRDDSQDPNIARSVIHLLHTYCVPSSVSDAGTQQ